MKPEETIFIVAGSIPNKRSTPLVDEWFGLQYENGKFIKSLSMNELLAHTGFRSTKIPNSTSLTEADVAAAEKLLPDAVEHAKHHLDGYYQSYQSHINPLLDEELDKLAELETRHKSYQLSLFESERRKTSRNVW